MYSTSLWKKSLAPDVTVDLDFIYYILWFSVHFTGRRVGQAKHPHLICKNNENLRDITYSRP
jgi:hypothetical protein